MGKYFSFQQYTWVSPPAPLEQVQKFSWEGNYIFAGNGVDLYGMVKGKCMFNVRWGAAKSLQSCPTLCNPKDGSSPGSPVPGILQVRTLEWVAISFSKAWKWKGKVKSLSRVQLFATTWAVACQAPLSLGFSRQEYWSGCHFLLLESASHSWLAFLLPSEISKHFCYMSYC